MRKKQLATKLAVEPGLEDDIMIEGESATEGAQEKSPTDNDVEGQDSFAYSIDSTGQAMLYDGTLIVEPVSAELGSKTTQIDITDGNIVPRKTVKRISPGVLDVIKCSACGLRLHAFANTIMVHPVLKVATCSRCSKFFFRQEFLRDSSGKDENCQWCADGGDLICCDTCSSAFCKRCIKRNLGRTALQNIESLGDDDTWSCFVCDRTPIISLQLECSEVLEKVQEFNSAQRRRSDRALGTVKNRTSTSTKVPQPVSKVASSSVYTAASDISQSGKPNEKITTPASDTIKTISAVLTQLSQLGSSGASRSLSSLDPSKLSDALRSVTQTLSKSPAVTTAKISASPAQGRSAALGRPTTLGGSPAQSSGADGNLVSNRNPTTVAAVPGTPSNTQSQSFNIGIILNQIAHVNNANIDVALKATRRCIETFSSDLLRLETKLQKAKEPSEIARIVRSFQSIYRFHFFARLANLSSRIREELTFSGASSSLATTRSSTSGTKMSPNSTIDLTEDTEQPSANTPLSSRHPAKTVSNQQLSLPSSNLIQRSPSPPRKRHCPAADQINSTTDEECERNRLSPLSSASHQSPKSADPGSQLPPSEPDSSSPQEQESSNAVSTSLETPELPSRRSLCTQDGNGEVGVTVATAEEVEEEEEEEADEDDVDWKLDVLASLARRTEANSSTVVNTTTASGSDVSETVNASASSVELESHSKDIGAKIGSTAVVDLRQATDLDHGLTPSTVKQHTKDASHKDLTQLEAELSSIERSLGSKAQPNGLDEDPENGGDTTDSEDNCDGNTSTCDVPTPKKTKCAGTVLTKSKCIPEQSPVKSCVTMDNDCSTAEMSEHEQEEPAATEESLANAISDPQKDDDLDATMAMRCSPTVVLQADLRSALLTREEDDYTENLTSRADLLHSSSDEADSTSGDNGDTGTRAVKQKCADSVKQKAKPGEKTATYHGLPRSLMASVWSSSDDEKNSNAVTDNRKRRNKTTDSQKARESSVEDEDDFNDSLARERKNRSKSKVNYRELDDESVASSDHESSTDSENKEDDTKSSRKKPILTSENESENTDDSNVQDRRQRRHHRRRLTKRPRSLSDEDGSNNSHSSDEGGRRGRKKIRAILGESRVSLTTKTAEAQERERRKRIAERQKIYNDSVLQEGSGLHVVTKRLVLEKPSADSDVAIEVHSEILKHLKPHQVEAVRFLWDCVVESVGHHKLTVKQPTEKQRVSGAIVAHCMGLGKTLSVIAFVHTLFSYPAVLNIRTCLIICPVNTLLNWKQEWEMWLPKDNGVDVFELASKSQSTLRVDILKHWHAAGGVMLIGYDMFRNLVNNVAKRGRKKAAKATVTAALLNPGPDIVVCDEGHLLKNAKSGLSSAVSEMISLKRIMLTGTPLQNCLSEYHAMVSFVKPDLLGTAKEFSNRFSNPIKNGQHRNSTERDVNLMKRRAHVLYKTLEGCIQRKDYSALSKYLPPRYEYVVKCRMTDVQCLLYRRYLFLRDDPTVANSLALLSPIHNVKNVRKKTLFADQQTLYRIWTHPYTLRLHEAREARRALLLDEEEDEDETFIVDSSTTDASSPEDTDSSGSTKDDGSGSEAVDDKPNTSKSTRYTTRSSRLASKVAPAENSCDDDDDDGDGDVVCIDSSSCDSQIGSVKASRKKRLRSSGEPDKIDNIISNAKQDEPWWCEYYKDEYDWRVDVGAKLDVMFRLLKKCQDIGDKLLIFTHSLFSLDLIERFLGEIHRQWLVSQGHVPPPTCSGDVEPNYDNRPDLSEYYSDIGLNTWTRGFDYERMDGSMSVMARTELQNRFNRPQNTRFRLFLISTRAGGLGVNLIAANRIIMFDVSWNPSHDIQSIFRAYRFGQLKPVYIYRLIAQGTMEEKIYDRQVTKQSLSLRVIDEQQIDRHFTFNDLQALFDFDPTEWNGPDATHRTLQLPKDRLLADMLSEFPRQLVGYHEHDSLLEHREDEGLTEAQRQEAWREYEEEKSSGLSMVQYHRIMAAQEEHVQQQAFAQQRFQMSLQQPQLILPHQLQSGIQPSPLLAATTNLFPPRGTNVAMASSTSRLPPIHLPQAPTPDISYPQLYSQLRSHLLATHPSLTADPIRVEKLVMSQLLETLTKPTGSHLSRNRPATTNYGLAGPLMVNYSTRSPGDPTDAVANSAPPTT